jgi:hypothetical protein
VVQTFTDAVRTVDPKRTTGSLPALWAEFAKYYEDAGDVAAARAIFERAVQVYFKSVNELVTVWCEFVELELRQEYVFFSAILGVGAKGWKGEEDADGLWNREPQRALALLGRATAVPKKRKVDDEEVRSIITFLFL